MSETKWTKGSLTVRDMGHGCEVRSFARVAWCGQSMAAGGGESQSISPSEARANASLFAAAPEMYEALEALLDDYTNHMQENVYTENARAALKKARDER
jgi:hypothetical protein